MGCHEVMMIGSVMTVNPLNAELNPICLLLSLLGGATIVVVSRLRVKVQAAVSLNKFKKYIIMTSLQMA